MRARSSNSTSMAMQQQQQQQQQSWNNQQNRMKTISETQSGVGWENVAPALQLLHLAASQSSQLSLNSGNGSSEDTSTAIDPAAAVVRHLYIDALKYLLRGLPTDLDEPEVASLRSSLSSTLTPPATQAPNPPAQVPLQRPSLLHRALARTIVLVFTLTYTVLAVVLPYLRVVFAKLWRYEREHKVCQTVLEEGTRLWIGLGKGAAGLAWECGGGDVVEWVVEGVQGGVREGVEGGWRAVASQAVAGHMASL